MIRLLRHIGRSWLKIWFGSQVVGPGAPKLLLRALPGRRADCTPGPRLVTTPPDACQRSLGCSIFDVLCEDGAVGLLVMACRGAFATERQGLLTQIDCSYQEVIQCSAVYRNAEASVAIDKHA